MRRIFSVLLIIAACCFFFSTSALSAESITGSSNLELKTPVTPQIKATQRKIAQDSLTHALSLWVNEFFDNCLNPDNEVSKHFLDMFVDRCLQSAKEKTYIEGRELTIEYSIPNHILDQVITSYNSHFDALALKYWQNFSETRNLSNESEAFNDGMRAFFYSKAHIGSPIELQGLPAGTTMTQYLQSFLQRIINKVDISFSLPIISGKPPNHPNNPVDIRVIVDTIPFAYFPLTAKLPNGKTILLLKTDADGNASLTQLRIPFVAHGAFLHIRPDFSAILDPTLSLSAESFGLTLTENVDQTLIFNIVKPFFTLDYTASAVNQVTMPSVFTDKQQILRFLKDSLHLQLSTQSQTPDIAITINCQVSSYTFDEREETQMKVEARTVVKDLKPNGHMVEKIEMINDKYFDINHKIPIGLFFWESSNALRHLIRKALDEL